MEQIASVINSLGTVLMADKWRLYTILLVGVFVYVLYYQHSQIEGLNGELSKHKEHESEYQHSQIDSLNLELSKHKEHEDEYKKKAESDCLESMKIQRSEFDRYFAESNREKDSTFRAFRLEINNANNKFNSLNRKINNLKNENDY